MTKEATLSVYNSIGWWTVGIAVAVLLLSPIVTRWMHLDTLKDEPVTPDPRPEEGLRVNH
jgi:proton-dependent oligopeptide transporter, POT family